MKENEGNGAERDYEDKAKTISLMFRLRIEKNVALEYVAWTKIYQVHIEFDTKIFISSQCSVASYNIKYEGYF